MIQSELVLFSVLRPCFERYANYHLVNSHPYHTEYHMKKEEDCLMFCAQTASRCRSVVYDTFGHVCHFFLDDSLALTVFSPKMIFLRVANTECLQEKLLRTEISGGMNSESSLTLPSSSSDILPPSFGISSDSSDKVLSPANIAELNPAAVPPLPPTDYDLLQAAAKNANFGQTNGIDQHISSVEDIQNTETATPQLVSDQQLQTVPEKQDSLGSIDDRLTSLSAELADLSTIPLEDTQFTGSFDEEPKDKSNEVLRDLAGTEEAEKRWTDSLSAIKKKPVDEKKKDSEQLVEDNFDKEFNEKLGEHMNSFEILKGKYETIGGDSFEDEKSNKLDKMNMKMKKRRHDHKDGAKLIKFDVDNAIKKKEIRRKPSNKESEGTIKDSYIKKAKSFAMNLLVNDAETSRQQKEIEDQLEMIEMPKGTDQIETMQVEPASEAQEVQEEKVKRKDWMSGCEKGERNVWLSFENSLNVEEGEEYSLTKDECKQECEKQNCRTMTYNEKESKCILAGGEGVWLTVSNENDFGAQTDTRFCFSDSLPIFEHCNNFVAFRDYNLKATPKEEFDGLPKGHQGMQLCIELCVLSNRYTCRSASFDVREGICRLNEEDSLSMPSAFKATHRTDLLYFENGCSQAADNDPSAKYSSVERVEKIVEPKLQQTEFASEENSEPEQIQPQGALRVMKLKEVRIQPNRPSRLSK
ncbi:hypothetical protein WR25_25389 [Diploscapter pachys]|uniref:Apple domain-containing protein n=1 Tax=Diploscapter pachys TaxID=2018661 RepID=A0A2A2JRM6_9BILA|nr:hypothetical protein WR25_25389 [Diploscapter pachys]